MNAKNDDMQEQMSALQAKLAEITAQPVVEAPIEKPKNKGGRPRKTQAA